MVNIVQLPALTLRMDQLADYLKCLLNRISVERLPSTPLSTSSPSLHPSTSLFPVSFSLQNQASQALRFILHLLANVVTQARNLLVAAQSRQAGYVKLTERWHPALCRGWETLQSQAYLLSEGTTHEDLLKIIVAVLAVFATFAILLVLERRRSALTSHHRRPSALSTLSRIESSDDSDSSFTSDDSLDFTSSSLRRSASPRRIPRHFAVGSASKRVDKKSSLIRITSSDPSSTLCHMPVELDLLAPTMSSSSHVALARSSSPSHSVLARSSSPSHAAAMAALKRRKKRMGIKLSSGEGQGLSDEVAALLGKDSDTAEEGSGSPELDADSPETCQPAQPGDATGISPSQHTRLAPPSSAVRTSSPLRRPMKLRPPMRIRRAASPCPNETPETIPERNSSYHKLNGVVQAIAPKVVGGQRTDAPPSILRKRSQIWPIPVPQGNDGKEPAGSRLCKIGSGSTAAGGDASDAKTSYKDQRPSSSPTSSDALRLSMTRQQRAKRMRAIKLTEPDWTPYVTMHERARERLEKKREKERMKHARYMSVMNGAASPKRNSFSGANGVNGSVKRRESLKRKSQIAAMSMTEGDEDTTSIGGDWLAYSSLHSPGLEEESGQSIERRTSLQRSGSAPRRRLSNGSQQRSSKMSMSSSSPTTRGPSDQNEEDEEGEGENESDFWFERYIPSTAAAGKDWDWRKRRAKSKAEAQAQVDARLILSLEDNGGVGLSGGVEEDDEDELPRIQPEEGETGGEQAGEGTMTDPAEGEIEQGGLSGGYIINGHTFSHGLVGVRNGYRQRGTGGTSSPSHAGSPGSASPRGGSLKERRRQEK